MPYLLLQNLCPQPQNFHTFPSLAYWLDQVMTESTFIRPRRSLSLPMLSFFRCPVQPTTSNSASTASIAKIPRASVRDRNRLAFFGDPDPDLNPDARTRSATGFQEFGVFRYSQIRSLAHWWSPRDDKMELAGLPVTETGLFR